MTNHVWRGEVAHYELVVALLDELCDLISNALDAHLRVLVVSRNLRGGDHGPLLCRELLLDTTIEEERDVRILLRLWRSDMRYQGRCGRMADTYQPRGFA